MALPLPNAAACGCVSRSLLTLAGVYGGLAVGFGAYRAHGLPRSLQAAGLGPEEIADRVSTLGFAVQYTLLHTLAIVAVVALTHLRFRTLTASLFSCGIFCFSGSLTLDAVWNQDVPSFVPPLGGMLLIAGWLSLVFVAWFPRRAKADPTC